MLYVLILNAVSMVTYVFFDFITATKIFVIVLLWKNILPLEVYFW